MAAALEAAASRSQPWAAAEAGSGAGRPDRTCAADQGIGATAGPSATCRSSGSCGEKQCREGRSRAAVGASQGQGGPPAGATVKPNEGPRTPNGGATIAGVSGHGVGWKASWYIFNSQDAF
jgi:hypothetical protein